MSENTKFHPTIDDQVVLDLLPNYLKSRRLEVFQLQRLLAENEYEKIRLIGHNLGGSGGLYGMQPLSLVGKRIEQSALNNDLVDLQTCIQDLHEFLDSVEI